MLGLFTSYKMLDQQLAILARRSFFISRAGVPGRYCRYHISIIFHFSHITSAVQSEEEEFVNAATVDYDPFSSNAMMRL
jgi:hypothetical protein